MRAFINWALVVAGIIGIGAAPEAIAQERPSGKDAARQCAALGQAYFSSVRDAPARVTEASVIAESNKAPGYCQITGHVAPSVGFVLRLPLTHWNGKFLELGCGGWCGNTDHISDCKDVLHRGYACIVSDGGHQGASLGDVRWAYRNVAAHVDFAYRAAHVTAQIGKAIVKHYYGQAPTWSYFMGCSAGGTQALSQAQRFPEDFDGVIAGAPWIRWAETAVDRLWDQRALTDSAGKSLLAERDLERLHQAVVTACDRNDGLKDNLIGDPRHCDFDLAALRCTSRRKDQCLTDSQIEAVRKIYRGPVTEQGRPLALAAASKGSERTWLSIFGPAAEGNGLEDSFRYFLLDPPPGAAWRRKDFDFDSDSPRLRMTASLEPKNPDLRPFKAAGGKLLVYMGWSDAAAGGVLPTVDYYEAAEKIAGGRAATQAFFRLFLIPGMHHCGGGAGASAVDWLSYLEAWVEQGVAPDRIIGAHVRVDDLKLERAEDRCEMQRRLTFPLDPATVAFTRPVFPYPIRTKYSGQGNPREAVSFVPVEP